MFNWVSETTLPLNSGDEDVMMASVITLAQLALNNICYDEVFNDLKKKHENLTEVDLKNFVWEILDDITKDHNKGFLYGMVRFKYMFSPNSNFCKGDV